MYMCGLNEAQIAYRPLYVGGIGVRDEYHGEKHDFFLAFGKRR